MDQGPQGPVKDLIEQGTKCPLPGLFLKNFLNQAASQIAIHEYA